MIKKNNIKFIDLDLPSKILWGDRNFGNNKYYQWGDLIGFSKSQIESRLKIFDYEHYKFSKKDKLIKYNNSDKLLELLPEDDIVTLALGNNYRIPRKEDFEELLKYTDKIYYNKSSLILMSKINGNQIIFPFSGYTFSTFSLWSSSLYKNSLIDAWGLYVNGNGKDILMTKDFRCNGCIIRPIYDKEK